MKKILACAMVALSVGMTAAPVLTPVAIAADEAVDMDIMNKIRDEGFNRSEVMKTLGHLTDNIGSRLSGSPGMTEANNWTKDKMTEWGLENAHLEGFEFGRGWTYEHVAVTMTSPRLIQVQAFPVAWHPGTDGVVEGSVTTVNIKTEADFEKYKGKLAGKIVAVSEMVEIKEPNNKVFTRRDEESLHSTEEFRVPGDSGFGNWRAARAKRMAFAAKVATFMKEEGVLATVKASRRTGGTFDASGYSFKVGKTPALPQVSMAAESYNRMLRLMKQGEDVKLKMDVQVTFHDEDTKNYNTIAEIPGKGRKPEIVMAGAHLDSWHLGDGAVDNGAGVAVVMEAVRILKAIGVEPKRTIRVGLWGSEEQGLYGSRNYVMDHFATFPEREGDKDPSQTAVERIDTSKQIQLKPDHAKLSAYFNLDNGSGKIRGIYTEGNVAAKAIFDEWLKPFHDLGAKTTTNNKTGGTDHLAYQGVGLPGYQFIQDPLDYGARLHHTQLDVLDNAVAADLKQASVIMAAFIYNAAMRDERMPRKPLPKPKK